MPHRLSVLATGNAPAYEAQEMDGTQRADGGKASPQVLRNVGTKRFILFR